MSKKRVLLWYTVVAAAWAVVLAILLTLRRSGAVAEFWSTHFAAAYVAVIGRLTSILPFSLFECLVFALVVGGVSLLVFGIVSLCKKRFFGVLCGTLATVIAVLSVLNLYTATAGFAYYRQPLRVPQYTEEPDESFVLSAASYFRDDFYALADSLERDSDGNVVCPYSRRQLSDKIAEAFDKAALPGLYAYTPRGKTMTNSWLLSRLRLTGITFLPTAEPNVNGAMPSSDVPQTMAHEMAHAKGVAREGDANLVSYYVLLNSDDPYLRYCGYFSCYSQIPNAVYITTQDAEQTKAFAWPAVASTESANVVAYWQKQPDIIGSISEFFNNLYLKLNGANNGTNSYQDGTNSGIIDTGDKTEDDKPIYKPYYSTLQRIFFGVYAGQTT